MYVPEQRFRSTTDTYQGNHLLRSGSIVHEYGEVRTFKDVRHDRISSSVRCPYCLQDYVERDVQMNDDLSKKKSFLVDTYHKSKLGTHF